MSVGINIKHLAHEAGDVFVDLLDVLVHGVLQAPNRLHQL